jgi:cytochrome bd-type quinol oxidase subunit 1
MAHYMELTALLLSRIQFAFTIAYHIVFPTLNMGLALFLMGAVSGVVLSYKILRLFR